MNKKGSPTFQNTSDKKIHPYMTPPTLAGKKGVSSMGVSEPEEKDFSKREESCDSCEKVAKESINTSNMSKFLFDKLFEDVMSGSEFDGGDDAGDLGIDVGGGEGGEDRPRQRLDALRPQVVEQRLRDLLVVPELRHAVRVTARGEQDLARVVERPARPVARVQRRTLVQHGFERRQ